MVELHTEHGLTISEATRLIDKQYMECVFHMFSHDAKQQIKEACMRKQRPGPGTAWKDK